MIEMLDVASASGHRAADAPIVLDWSSGGPDGAAKFGPPRPCTLCGRPANLRSPRTGEIVHKVCAEAWLTAKRDRRAPGARWAAA